MSKKKEEKKMAAPAKPINDMKVEMPEEQYNDFINYATNKKTSFTPAQEKIRAEFKKHEQIQKRK